MSNREKGMESISSAYGRLMKYGLLVTLLAAAIYMVWAAVQEVWKVVGVFAVILAAGGATLLLWSWLDKKSR